MYYIEKDYLGKGNYFIKNKLGEEIPPIDVLKEMLESNNYRKLVKKIKFYAKIIGGTVSFWYQVKEQLKFVLKQHCSSNHFFTLFYADLHWLEFHTLFGNVKII